MKPEREALEIGVLRTMASAEIGFNNSVAWAVLQSWSEFNGGKSHKEDVQPQLHQPQHCTGWSPSCSCSCSCLRVSLSSCLAPDLQMKAHCKHRGRPSALSSRLAKRVTHLKQKVAAQRGAATSSMLHCAGSLGGEDESKSDCRNERKGR